MTIAASIGVLLSLMIARSASIRLRSSSTRQYVFSRFSRHLCVLAESTEKGSITSSPLTETSSGGRKSAAVSAINKQDDSIFQSKLDLNPPKGTRDFYPDDKRLSNWLFDHWRRIAASYGFEEYDAPVLEKEVLYIRKSGDEVTGQLYNFVDKGDNRVSLRPEMTPSLARMVLAKKSTLSFPLKWFSIPQCWRYERMTRGRRREHYQWNMDIWGVAGVEAEAELLSAVVTCFQNLGLTSTDVGIKINSRKILEGVMQALSIPEALWASACVQVDKLDKLPAEAVIEELVKLGVTAEAAGKLVEALKKKDISEFVSLLGEDSRGVQDIRKIFTLAKAYGVDEWLQFDASVVRGLSYYTGIVFEGYDKTGTLRAICGGGRYDKLIDTMSGGETSLPAVGFGFGDAVIVELLKMKNLIPEHLSQNKISVLVYYMASASPSLLQEKAIAAATRLRQAGLATEVLLEDKKAKWAFQRADKLGADYVVMYAENEASKGQVVVKNMRNSEQNAIDEESLVAYIKDQGQK